MKRLPDGYWFGNVRCMGEGYARPPRNRPSIVTVLAVIAAIGLAIPAVNRGLPASHTATGAIPYPVTASVSIVPPADSTMDQSGTRPGISHGTAAFRIGPVRYLVVVGPYPGTAGGAAQDTRDRGMSFPGYQVSTWHCFVTDSGLLGRWSRFSAWGWGSAYAVLFVAGLRIELTASGPDARMNTEMNGIERSMRTLTYRTTR